MKNSNKICDLEIISRFYDNELEQEEYNRVKDHINGCPRCKEALTDLTNISSPVKDYLLNNMPQPQFARIENSVINKIHQKKIPLREKIFHLFILKLD